MHETREDFEQIRQQIRIEMIADYLLQKQGKKYIYPGEKTGSIKLYPDSNTFYDFGRGVGGDVVRLWSHVRGCDSWQALKKLKATFGLSMPDRTQSRDAIIAAEQSRKRQQEAEKEAKRQWVREVDRLKAEAALLSGILSSGHCEPLSWLWCTCKNRLTTANIQLDLLCGV